MKDFKKAAGGDFVAKLLRQGLAEASKYDSDQMSAVLAIFYQSAIKSDPTNQNLHQGYIDHLMAVFCEAEDNAKQQASDYTEEAIKDAIAQFPNNYTVRKEYGSFLYLSGRHIEAAEELNQTLLMIKAIRKPDENAKSCRYIAKDILQCIAFESQQAKPTENPGPTP